MLPNSELQFTLHRSRPADKPDCQLSALLLTETEFSQERKAFKGVQVHEERQNSCGTQFGLPQHDATPRVVGEISFEGTNLVSTM